MKNDLKQLITEKLTGDEIIVNAWELYDLLDHDGSVHELIDSNIDIYYHAIREWAVNNWQYVEQAISQGITNGTDYHKLIQAGQYVQLTEQAHEAVEELYNELDGDLFNVKVTA